MLAEREAPPATDARTRALLLTVRRALLMVAAAIDRYLAGDI
jgi:hypothetical protein